MLNIQKMFNYTSNNNIRLLSDYSGVFWLEYLTNSDNFDNVFRNRFKEFYYYDQEDDDCIEDVVTRFIQNVKDWLLVNNKRYSELYRVNCVNDNDYSILNNYDMTREYQGTDYKMSSLDEGARTDTNDFTEGSQNKESQSRISAFNSNDYASKDSMKNASGTRNDVNEFTKGEQQSTFASNEADAHNSHEYGNIGVSTQTDVMRKHSDYWKVYNFYIMIFDEICEQFLMV